MLTFWQYQKYWIILDWQFSKLCMTACFSAVKLNEQTNVQTCSHKLCKCMFPQCFLKPRKNIHKKILIWNRSMKFMPVRFSFNMNLLECCMASQPNHINLNIACEVFFKEAKHTNTSFILQLTGTYVIQGLRHLQTKSLYPASVPQTRMLFILRIRQYISLIHVFEIESTT